MAYDTFVGHFNYGGESYSFVTTSELKFELYKGRWMTRIGVQTGSDEVKNMLYDLFIHMLKVKITFDLQKGKHIDVHNCVISRFTPYTFGAQATIEGFMKSNDYIKEKVNFT